MARGRKNGVREPNGRLSRKKEHVEVREWETAREARSVALEARQRVFGISEAEASDPFAGTLLGRMHQQGRISTAQIDAAGKYTEVRSAYHRAIDATPWHDEKRIGGEGTKTHEEWAAEVKERHEAMDAVISEVCREERSTLPRTALENIVVRDVQMPFLDGYLRSVLNRLHQHFFVDKRRAAA